MDYIYPKEKKKLLNNYMQNKLCLRPRHNINKQDKENQKWLLCVVCHKLENIDFQSTKTPWEVITFLRKTNIN